MASRILNGSVWQANLYTYQPAERQVGINTLHYLASGQVGLGALDTDFATLLNGTYNPIYLPLLATNAEFVGAGVVRVFPTPRTLQVNDGTGAAAGTSGSAGLPSQVCGLITKKTDLGGRSGKGHIYIPFPGQSFNTAGSIPSAAYQILLTTLCGNLDDMYTVTSGANSTILTPVVYNRLTHVSTPITGCAGQQYWATQRRRGNYGKTNPLPF